MSLPWLKLYCEILDDPKMGKLPEWLFGRMIKFFLMAGREGKDGLLPPVEDMLWTLRPTREKNLDESLRMLAEVGVTHQAEDGSWWIVNFKKRQASDDPTNADRQRRFKERHKKVTGDNALPSSISSSESFNSFSDSSISSLRIWESITGFTAFISKSKEDDIESINALFNNHGNNTVEYCKPFYDEWVRRGYHKTNTAWLDWAITGQIPEYKPRQEPKSNFRKTQDMLDQMLKECEAKENVINV